MVIERTYFFLEVKRLARSLRLQGLDALRSVVRFNESRREHQQAGTADRYIFSCEFYRAVRSDVGNCLNWIAKNYGVRYIKHVTPQMVQKYVDHRIQSGEWRSAWTVKNFSSSMGKLAHAVKSRYGLERHFRPENGFVIPNELQQRKLGTQIQIKPYGDVAAKKVVDWVSARNEIVGKALETSRSAGLRVGELAKIRVSDLRPESNTLIIRDGAPGGAKNGRGRIVEALPPGFVRHLKEWAESRGAKGDDRIFPRSERTIERWEKDARDALGIRSRDGRGVHGLRGNYYNNAIKAGWNRDDLNRSMGHGRDVPNYRRQY